MRSITRTGLFILLLPCLLFLAFVISLLLSPEFSGGSHGDKKIKPAQLKNEGYSSASTSEAAASKSATGEEEYLRLLPKSFKPLKTERLDFDADGRDEVAILGQDHSDIKFAGTGDEIASYRIFVFKSDSGVGDWMRVLDVEVDDNSTTNVRGRVIVEQSFGRISLTRNYDALAYLTVNPSASGPCMDRVEVLYWRNGEFQRTHLEGPFPLCLISFRQDSIGTLGLMFDVFRTRDDGTFLDAHCCPTGGHELQEYSFQGSSFRRTRVEQAPKP